MQIRKITDENDSIILQIAKAEKENFGEPMSEKTIRESVKTSYFGLYSAEEDGKLLSYVATGQVFPEMQINSIASAVKKSGYGKAILNHLLNTAKKEGYNVITLEVRVSNTAAQNLYKSFGFSIISTRKRLYSNPQEDGYCMILEL